MSVVVMMVVVAVVGPVAAQLQGLHQGRFQLHASCHSENILRYLVVNGPMWLRTGDEELTLLTSITNDTCSLPPLSTFRVTAHISLEVEMVGASGKGEGKEEAVALCSFPKQDARLVKGLLKVSCLKERGEAEAEMRGAEDSPDDPAIKDSAASTLDASITSAATSTTTPATNTTTPATTATTPAIPATAPISRARLSAGRDLDLNFPSDASQPTALTARPTDAHEPLETQPTPRSVASTDGATSSLETTMTVAEPSTPSSTRPAVTDGALTVATPGGSATQEAGHAGTPTPPSSKLKSLIKKESISQTDGDKSGMADDQVLYLAGAGAGVLALVLGVAVVAGVVHYRRRQAIAAARKEDLFISGGYRGSMNSLTHTGKGGGGSGAYLNANVMYYSGADPEMAESFELEERVLSSSGMSYSLHDIPKCLKE